MRKVSMQIIDFNSNYQHSLMNFIEKVFCENDIILDITGKHIDLTQPEMYYTSFVIVIDKDDNVCGCLGLRVLDEKKKILEIKRLYLLQKYHHLGYGKGMFDLIINRAQNMQYKYLRLDTEERFSKAIGLIKSRGFYPIERYNSSAATLFFEKLL